MLALVQKLVDVRGPGTTCISKVKGHVDDDLVRGAGFGRLIRLAMTWLIKLQILGGEGLELGLLVLVRISLMPVGFGIRSCSICIGSSLPLLGLLLIMTAGGVGGIAPDPMVWSAGGRPKRRRPAEAVRDLAVLPGPQRLWAGGWFEWPDIHVSVDDVGRWPFSSIVWLS